MGHDILIRSTGKLIFHNKIQQSSIDLTRLNIIKRSNRSTKEINIIGIGEITQLGVLFSHHDYATRLHSKPDLTRKRRTKKMVNKMANFL